MQINVDGEVLAMEGRLEFEVVPRALGVYAPATPMEPVWVNEPEWVPNSLSPFRGL